MVYKYQEYIDKLIECGVKMPDVDAVVEGTYYRYAFADKPEKNHIPQYVSSPKRMLKAIDNNNARMTLLALSCYQDADKALEAFAELKLNYKNIEHSVGESLFSGIITVEDGNVTPANEATHFNLFESTTCDLNNTFTFMQSMI